MAAPPDSSRSLLGTLAELGAEVKATLRDYVLLASLEARLATLGLIRMLIAGVCIAVLAVGTWAGLMMALALGLVDAGWTPAGAAALVALGGLIPAALLAWWIHRLSREVVFPATVRRLRGEPIPSPESPA